MNDLAVGDRHLCGHPAAVSTPPQEGRTPSCGRVVQPPRVDNQPKLQRRFDLSTFEARSCHASSGFAFVTKVVLS